MSLTEKIPVGQTSVCGGPSVRQPSSDAKALRYGTPLSTHRALRYDDANMPAEPPPHAPLPHRPEGLDNFIAGFSIGRNRLVGFRLRSPWMQRIFLRLFFNPTVQRVIATLYWIGYCMSGGRRS